MRIEIRQVMSMKLHGATCHLLILDNKTYILLDCGINPNFDFSHYRAQEQALSRVSITLITHPSVEHLGALPFLLQELNIKPKVYASQTVIILGPLNIHEAMINQRYEKYNSDILRRIYLIFENVISVKPMQRKQFDLEGLDNSHNVLPSSALEPINPNRKLDEDPHNHSIHLMCYQVGSEIGSICWRISYCMFSCVYLIGYNNYKQYHLDGMDLDSVISRKTDILITDTYANQREKPGVVRRDTFKTEIQNILKMYIKDENKSKKLIFSCQPNERLVELMNIMTQLSTDRVFEGKVDLVHYSFSYFQLIKSQLDYRVVDQIGDEDIEDLKANQSQAPASIFDKDFNYNKKLHNRICITTAAAVRPEGLLWQQLVKLSPDSLLIHVGRDSIRQAIAPQPLQNIPKLFAPVVVPTPAPMPQIQQQKPSEANTIKTEPTEPETVKASEKSMMSGQYIHCFNFPRFLSRIPEHTEWDSYGEHYDDFDRHHHEVLEQEALLAAAKPLEVKKKKTNIDTVNVEMKLPQLTGIQKLNLAESELIFDSHLTTFESSLQIINLINPEKIVLINGESSDYETYQRAISEMRSRSLAIQDRTWATRKFEIFGFERFKKYVVFENNSQTIEQALNLYNEQNLSMSDLSSRNFLKVNGTVVLKPNNTIEIVLVESGEKELMEFNMAEFYKSINSRGHCRFTDNGVLEINDVKLYRRKNQITIEGLYSIEYFQLRERLYKYVSRQEF